ncbi:MAG: nucleotide exchange factor GrpE [bacterium]|nr:nucleotide exchange factor GrpE [bacterium]
MKKTRTQEEIEELEKERDEYLEGWKRAKADFINYKREETERVESRVARAEETVMKDMLQTLASLKLGIASLKENTPERNGMELVRRELENALEKYGVEKIQVDIGGEFNPETEECVEAVEREDKPKGTVIEEVETGYKRGIKVIQPAKVKVVK